MQPALRYLEEHGYGRGPGNLDLALRSFISSYDRFPARRDSQLVDVVTAAEALLGTESEITFRLAFRGAGMLGRTTGERLQVFEDMKDFYDVRSKIVHGATLKGWRPKMLARSDDTREFIRRLLVAFVRLAASSSSTRYITVGRPPRRPCAGAAARPAMVRSWMMWRSSSAKAAIMVKKNLPSPVGQ